MTKQELKQQRLSLKPGLKNEYELIKQKKSKLPARDRELIVELFEGES